jgi:malonate-semialdehyde dehydrogenase (acetylating)/methylmalonate-semialdehyde dehydrogenase
MPDADVDRWKLKDGASVCAGERCMAGLTAVAVGEAGDCSPLADLVKSMKTGPTDVRNRSPTWAVISAEH